MTGFGGFEMEADDVLFRNCRLDLANFEVMSVCRGSPSA
jgi:hypothetical protein